MARPAGICAHCAEPLLICDHGKNGMLCHETPAAARDCHRPRGTPLTLRSTDV